MQEKALGVEICFLKIFCLKFTHCIRSIIFEPEMPLGVKDKRYVRPYNLMMYSWSIPKKAPF